MVQRTMVMIKSDVMERGLWPEILTEFIIRPGFNICAMKMLEPTAAQWQKHFGHLPPEVRKKVIQTSRQTPVIVMVVEGDEAVARLRDAAGSTAPGEATRSTIRRRFGHASEKMLKSGKNPKLNNTVHTSATKDEADSEISNFFGSEEIHSHRFAYASFAY